MCLENVMYVFRECHVCVQRMSCMCSENVMYVFRECHVCFQRMSCMCSENVDFASVCTIFRTVLPL
jgi:hypothetical protein